MSNPNAPAFPKLEASLSKKTESGQILLEHLTYVGLSKREILAAMAMQGFVTLAQDYETRDGIARDSVNMADALLAELQRTEKKT